MTTCDVCYTSVHCSFRDSVNIACMGLSHPPLTNRFLCVTGIRTLGFWRRRYGRLFLAIAGLLVFFWRIGLNALQRSLVVNCGRSIVAVCVRDATPTAAMTVTWLRCCATVPGAVRRSSLLAESRWAQSSARSRPGGCSGHVWLHAVVCWLTF